MKQYYFNRKCSKCYRDAVKLCFLFWLNLVCRFVYCQIICYNNALFLTFCCYTWWFFQCFNNDCMGCGDMFICGKYQILCVSSSLGTRFEFQPAYIRVVLSLSVSMSAILIIYYCHASASFSSIKFVKIDFGFSGLLSRLLVSFLYGATSSPFGSYVHLRFLFLLFSNTSSFFFS